MEVQKFKYIDCLRGIAILLVLAIHNGQYGTSLSDIAPLFDKFRFAGRYGVQLFFLVSAYTLMLSYQNRKVESNHKRNFFIRRFFRIVPMYYIAFICYAIDSVFFATEFQESLNMLEFTLPDIIKNIFFLNIFYPRSPFYVPGGWSVVTEMFFYLLLPLIWTYAKNINKIILLFIGSLVLSVSFSSLFSDYFPTVISLYISFFNQLPVFILGILMYYIINQKKIHLNKWILILLIITAPFYLYFIDHDVFDCLKASVILFLFALLICKKQYKIVVNSFFSQVGKISFSMYLIHFGVLYWMNRLDFVDFIPCTSKLLSIFNYFVRYGILFMITGLLSYFSYLYLEKFFIKKGKEVIMQITLDPKKRKAPKH